MLRKRGKKFIDLRDYVGFGLVFVEVFIGGFASFLVTEEINAFFVFFVTYLFIFC